MTERFGARSGGTGLGAGLSSGLDCSVGRWAIPATRQTSIQNTSPASPPKWSGCPPGSPVPGPAAAENLAENTNVILPSIMTQITCPYQL
jgi:hypothetical protein